MKTKVITILAALLILTGCGKTEKNTAMDEVNASESASATDEAYAEASAEESKAVPFAPEEQLAVIENSFDTWKENNDDRNAVKNYTETKYAIADMDKDGFLEIIKETYGKVPCEYDIDSAYTTIYEVTADHSIEQLNMDCFRKLKLEPAVLKDERLNLLDDNAYVVSAINEIYGYEYYKLSFDKNSVILETLPDDGHWDYDHDAISAKEMISVFTEVNSETIKTSYEKRYQRAKEDKTGIYTAFLNNEIKAKVDCDDYIFECDERKEYNFEELKELASDNIFVEKNICNYFYEYIDCGCDGENELLIRISHNDFAYSFVIKDKGGELFIRYVAECADKFSEGISEDGYVSGFGKGGASLAIYDYGFLDKDARYHVFYTCQYYLSLDSGMAGIVDEEVLNNYQLLVYTFDKFGEGNDEDAMCALYHVSRVADIVYPEPDPQIKKAFIDDGYKFYSEKEIKERLLKRADEIGLSKLDIPEWQEDVNNEFDD